MADDISLILPGQQAVAGVALTSLSEVVWLRNPKTGVIHKLLHPAHDDSIQRCLSDGYTLSSETAARAQAIELAQLQGRALPAWADEQASEKPADKASEKTASAKRG